tara:strand:- start:495 stop:608 length:114 start_codon:yes stop_codon:yes gene_type:complete
MVEAQHKEIEIAAVAVMAAAVIVTTQVDVSNLLINKE